MLRQGVELNIVETEVQTNCSSYNRSQARMVSTLTAIQRAFMSPIPVGGANVEGVRLHTWSPRTHKMGKEKKAKRHQPLTQQITEEDGPCATKRPPKITKQEDRGGNLDYVDGRISRRILEQARLQQEELEEEFGLGAVGGGSGKKLGKSKKWLKRGEKGVPDEGGDSEGDTDSDRDEEQDELVSGGGDNCPDILEEDEQAMERFMSKDYAPRQTLADLIQDKIRDKQTELSAHMTDATAPTGLPQMDEKVVSIFKSVAKILAKYRSGKLPKAFKVIPSLSNWEEVLYLTEPENWSAAAMFQATRIFCSNLNSTRAQRFYNLVLLPRVRDDITEYKRLNFHLYMALKKSLFKPAAFFKGLLLPLCDSGTCTLREALIIGSVLVKTSVPMLHSSAALLKLAEMDYNGANSIFIRTLLDKKYALPYRVVDAVVFHFVRFTSDDRELPVLWHQSLLTFVQRYKEDMSMEQKEALLELVRLQCHHDITPEIRREIVNSKCRSA